jgi:hypothetical protein
MARATQVNGRSGWCASGNALCFSAGVGCSRCSQKSRMQATITGWVARQYPDPGTYVHVMRCIKGLSLCAVCGTRATQQGPAALAPTCSVPGKDLLAYVVCQPPHLPDSHGRKQRPEGFLAGPIAALSAAGHKRRGAGDPTNWHRRNLVGAQPMRVFSRTSRSHVVYERVCARAGQGAGLMCPALPSLSGGSGSPTVHRLSLNGGDTV